MIQNLTAKGRKMIAIIDPHIKREPGYFVHEDCLREGLYVKDKNDKVYEGKDFLLVTAKLPSNRRCYVWLILFYFCTPQGGVGPVLRHTSTSLTLRRENIGHLAMIPAISPPLLISTLGMI